MPENSSTPKRLPNGWNESSYFRYQREHFALRLTIRSMTNHEIREVLIGLWSRLDPDDQLDHIKELTVYLANEPGTYISGIAAQIRDA